MVLNINLLGIGALMRGLFVAFLLARFVSSDMSVPYTPYTNFLGGDMIADAPIIRKFPFTTVGNTKGFTNQYSPRLCNSLVGASNAPDVVYGFQPDESSPIVISLCGSLFDTIIYLLDADGLPMIPLSEPFALCNDNSNRLGCQGMDSALELSVEKGRLYYIVVDGVGREEGVFQLTILYQGVPYSRTLTSVLQRGKLRCGVFRDNEPTVLGAPGANGQPATGMEPDMCRAIAAALFNDPLANDTQVEFISLTAVERTKAIITGYVDLLFCGTTATLGRATTWSAIFSPPYFYDEMVVAVLSNPQPGQPQLRNLADVNATNVKYCVVQGTTTELHALHTFTAATIVPVASVAEGLSRMQSKACHAVTGDRHRLASLIAASNGRNATARMEILPGVVAREPLAIATRAEDFVWQTLVTWVLWGSMLAEHYGMTQANMRDNTFSNKVAIDVGLLADIPLDVFLKMIALYPPGTPIQLTNLLPVDIKFEIRSIKRSGNYGEIYARNVEALIPRANTSNGLWTQRNGLHFPGQLTGEVGRGPISPKSNYDSLAAIRGTGRLICGAQSEESNVFTTPANTVLGTKAKGMNVDLCRAVAAAVFNTSTSVDARVELVKLTANTMFDAVLTSIHVLIRSATIVVTRDFLKAVRASTPYYYDLHGFVVNATRNPELRTIADMNKPGLVYCAIEGSSQNFNMLYDRFELTTGLQVRDRLDGEAKLAANACQVLTADYANLASIPGILTGATDLKLINETLYREPFAAWVRDADLVWGAAVDAVISGLMIAEYYGITTSNVDTIQFVPGSEAYRLLSRDPADNPIKGLVPGFMRAVIKAVGNYGDIYARNVEAVIPRQGTHNNLWTHEGKLTPSIWLTDSDHGINPPQIYAPPRGGEGGGGTNDSTAIGLGIGLGVGLGLFVLIIILVLVFLRKKKSEDKPALAGKYAVPNTGLPPRAPSVGAKHNGPKSSAAASSVASGSLREDAMLKKDRSLTPIPFLSDEL